MLVNCACCKCFKFCMVKQSGDHFDLLVMAKQSGNEDL